MLGGRRGQKRKKCSGTRVKLQRPKKIWVRNHARNRLQSQRICGPWPHGEHGRLLIAAASQHADPSNPALTLAGRSTMLSAIARAQAQHLPGAQASRACSGQQAAQSSCCSTCRPTCSTVSGGPAAIELGGCGWARLGAAGGTRLSRGRAGDAGFALTAGNSRKRGAAQQARARGGPELAHARQRVGIGRF